jgi:hypothetical protein
LAGDFSALAWQHNAELFYPESAGLSTRILDGGGGFQNTGWYDWIPDLSAPSIFDRGADVALVDDTGERMVRWAGGNGRDYRGLLGPSDPSQTQFPENEGGDALYFQEPPGSGPRLLVNECTGTGAGATQIPNRNDNGTPATPGDDLLTAQSCQVGSVVSRHGATLGGGGRPVFMNPLDGPAARAMSTDGNRVFFTSPDPFTGVAPDVCGALTYDNGGPAFGVDTNCPPQIYVRQRAPDGTATVRWLSRPEVPGQQVGLLGANVFEGASADGRVVYFRSRTPLTADDRNGTGAAPVTTGTSSPSSWDLYRYVLPESLAADPDDGVLTRITGGPNGTADPNTNSSDGARGVSARYVSDDGARAFFVTGAPIAGADATPPSHGTTSPGGSTSNATSRNLYLYDDNRTGADRWRFVAQIPFSSSGTRIDSCATRNHLTGLPQTGGGTDETVQRQGWISCVRGTPDGSMIVFESLARLTDDDTDDAADIYAYDAVTDDLVRISAPPPDSQSYPCDHDANEVPNQFCNGDLGFDAPFSMPEELFGLGGQRHTNLAVDSDGEVSVFFESRSALVADDVNGDTMDVYQWKGGELSLISPGNSDDHAWYSGNSHDGQDVFFQTSQRIDPREVEDADIDIYDARVGGGFPLPPEPPTPCDPLADVCQGGGASPTNPGTSTDAPGGGGNASPGSRVRLAAAKPPAKALRRAARTGVLRVTVKSSKAGRLAAVARGDLRTKNGKTVTRVIARGSVRLPRAGAKKQLTLRLSGAVKRQLRAGRRIPVTVVIRSGGARPATIAFALTGRGTR